MRRYSVAIGCEALILFILGVYAHTYPSMIVLLGIILLLVASLVMILICGALGFFRWRRLSRTWMMPSVLSFMTLAIPFLTQPVGVAFADWKFKNARAQYMSVVQALAHSDSPFSTEYTLVSVTNLPPHVRAVRVAKCGDGSIAVEFLIASDVPLLHSGYVSEGYSDTSDCAKTNLAPSQIWPYVRPVVEKWYHFSDSPIL